MMRLNGQIVYIAGKFRILDNIFFVQGHHKDVPFVIDFFLSRMKK